MDGGVAGVDELQFHDSNYRLTLTQFKAIHSLLKCPWLYFCSWAGKSLARSFNVSRRWMRLHCSNFNFRIETEETLKEGKESKKTAETAVTRLVVLRRSSTETSNCVVRILIPLHEMTAYPSFYAFFILEVKEELWEWTQELTALSKEVSLPVVIQVKSVLWFLLWLSWEKRHGIEGKKDLCKDEVSSSLADKEARIWIEQR